MRTQVDETPFLDPVFLAMGQKVYTYDYIEQLREENLQKKVTGKRSYNLVPQKGFQEKVLLSDADILVCGGKRGGGKEQPYSSLILAPNGTFFRMGDIEVGDIIADRYGNPQVVMQIFEQGIKDIYEIQTEDGKCKCGEFHLWTAYIKEMDAWMVLTTFELLSLLIDGYNLFLPKYKSDTELNKVLAITDLETKEPCRCILVSSQDHLYVTDDFIVTHNTWTALYKAMYNIYNPDVYCYAFRRLEDDIKRGPWKACKPVYRGFGTSFKETSYEVTFLQGKGCSVKMEHLADLGKVSDRLRGAELAYAMLEEVTEHTRENVDIIWDIASVNRNTAGIHSQLLCTCNPVGWSNKLRKLLEWYIDPETDTVIPERDGKIRYMFNYGSDITEIAWGDSWEEVYDNPKAHEKIDVLLMGSDLTPKDLILTLQFIEGDFSENKILQVADKRYVAKLATKGGANVVNDMRGIWRDVDSGTSLLSLDDMRAAFNNVEQRDGVMRASADVALSGDFFVIYALDGHHVCDIEAWRGVFSDEVVTFVRNFLKRNGVREENFTYDSNGLGLWLKGYFRRAQTFNNKAAPSDTRLWNNLKSECAEKFVKDIKDGKFSFAPEVLMRKFTDSKKQVFTVQERLENERLAIKRKDDVARFEIIQKPQMKEEIGHSPDFIEGLFMVEQLYSNTKTCVRKGFGAWGGRNW